TGTLWIALGIAFSLLAGFPEVAYIDGLLALLWFICRFATLRRRWRFALRVAWGGLLGLLLAAPLLVGFLSLIEHSSAFASRHLGLWAVATTAIPSIFVPYIFGPFPAATAEIGRFTPWGVNNYAGLVLIFFALLGFQARRPLSLRIGLVVWVALAWAKTFGLKPVMAAMNHVPFLLQTAFYQYASTSWILALIVLAAFGVDELRYRKPRLSLPVLGTFAALAVSIHIAWPWRHFWGSQPAEIAAMSRFLIFGLGWALAGLIGVGLLLVGPRRENRRLGIAAILAINAVVFFTIPVLSSVRPGFVDYPAIRCLQTHLGLSRFYTLGPIQANYSAYFQAASIDYDGLPIPGSFSKYVTKRLFPPLPKTGDEIFWPAAGWYDPASGLKYLCKFLPEYEALGVKYVVTASGTMETLAPQVEVPFSAGNAEALVLKANQQVQFTVSAPANPADSGNTIRGFAISLGNYGNRADGNLHVRLCAGGVCAEGIRALSESADNSFFYIPLSQPLTVASGIPITITVEHEQGINAVALWIVPDLPRQTDNLLGPDGKPMPGMAAQVAFTFDTSPAGVSKIYHDSVMDIFELPHPAPYYSVARGGPCHLSPSGRESLQALCDAPALLVRRELYMPGWHASLNGKRLDAEPYGDIFQSFNLPRGNSRLRFAYAPPYTMLAVCASLFAVAALLAEFVYAFRRRRSQSNTELAA
ncbi:MAG: hypothetical protein ACRD4O_06375, partial [Bryobacteraceae bacterium]